MLTRQKNSAVGQSKRMRLMNSCGIVGRFWINWDESNILPSLALSPNQLVGSNLYPHLLASSLEPRLGQALYS